MPDDILTSFDTNLDAELEAIAAELDEVPGSGSASDGSAEVMAWGHLANRVAQLRFTKVGLSERMLGLPHCHWHAVAAYIDFTKDEGLCDVAHDIMRTHPMALLKNALGGDRAIPNGMERVLGALPQAPLRVEYYRAIATIFNIGGEVSAALIRILKARRRRYSAEECVKLLIEAWLIDPLSVVAAGRIELERLTAFAEVILLLRTRNLLDDYETELRQLRKSKLNTWLANRLMRGKMPAGTYDWLKCSNGAITPITTCADLKKISLEMKNCARSAEHLTNLILGHMYFLFTPFEIGRRAEVVLVHAKRFGNIIEIQEERYAENCFPTKEAKDALSDYLKEQGMVVFRQIANMVERVTEDDPWLLGN